MARMLLGIFRRVSPVEMPGFRHKTEFQVRKVNR